MIDNPNIFGEEKKCKSTQINQIQTNPKKENITDWYAKLIAGQKHFVGKNWKKSQMDLVLNFLGSEVT